MHRIGVIFGMEESFPPALVDRINAQDCPDVTAERVTIGAVRMDEPCRYSVIVDRISHDVPFYRAYLKNAALAGTPVVNNPFWWSADDKFFNNALATTARRRRAADGAAAAQGASAGHRRDRSMRNLAYPLDWDAVFDYIGFPAFMKPLDGGGWKNVYKVRLAGGVLRRLRPDRRSSA